MAELNDLKQVKTFSDAGDYQSKHRLARQLIHEQPDQFDVTEEPDGLVGIQHKKTGFRFHLPRVVSPVEPVLPPVRKKAIAEVTWEDVPQTAVKYAVATADLFEFLAKEPYEGDIWASPETGALKYAALGDFPGPDEPWVLVKSSATVGDVMSVAGPFLNQTAFPFDDPKTGPRPIASALAGGLLGAGLGYAGGGLAEWLMPGTFSRGAAKTRGALLGAILGSTPGNMGIIGNHLQGKSIFDKAASLQKTCELVLGDDYPAESIQKEAALIFKPIQVDQFNEAIWRDPNTPPPIQAMTCGLVSGAGTIRNSELISPVDITRMAAGMGSGYASATLVGKTLGVLAGLSPDAQKALQQAGLWSGFLQSVVPPAFGVR